MSLEMLTVKGDTGARTCKVRPSQNRQATRTCVLAKKRILYGFFVTLCLSHSYTYLPHTPFPFANTSFVPAGKRKIPLEAPGVGIAAHPFTDELLVSDTQGNLNLIGCSS